MKPLLISACLLGTPCRYDGKSKENSDCRAISKHFQLIPICPEVMGGLSTPRPPCERLGNRILCEDGTDRTQEYNKGAEMALNLAMENGALLALLKEKSPSCGKFFRYDGSFQRKLVQGMGVSAELLSKNGILVFSENEIEELIKHQ